MMKHVYLTMTAVVRDQEHYVKEWLGFHYLAGYERFVVILHKCADKTEERIRELPFQDRIHIHRIVNDEQYVQLGSYVWAVENYGHLTKWMAFIDSDEFFFATKSDDMKCVLEDYEEHGGVLGNWLQFGSNNCAVRPAGLSIEALTKRAVDDHPDHQSFKTIIRPECFKRFRSPHLAETNPWTVTTDHRPACDHWKWYGDRERDWDILRVNHYHTRSMEDWIQRYYRGQCNDPNPNYNYGSDAFKTRDHNDVSDYCILRFADRLRELLQREPFSCQPSTCH